MLKIIGPAIKNSLPPHRRDALIAELKNNDPRFLRRQTRCYLDYLDRHGSLAPRLCESGARAWVVFGDRDDVGLTTDERQLLERCPTVTMITIADSGHFTLNEKPGQIAKVLLEALTS
jgi:pimeloyl-ACP methyl ester carboxylesterase